MTAPFSSELWLDYLLAAGVLLLAWLSLSTNKQFKSITVFISLGLLVTLVWARLGAWDVAMAEAAIGTGLTGALLLATWRRLNVSNDKPVHIQPAKAINRALSHTPSPERSHVEHS